MIRTPAENELSTIADFVAGLQAHPESRIAGFGDTAQAIAVYLASWESPWFQSSRVAEQDGDLVGFVAAELDESLGRAWIYGPLVDYPEWERLAENLLLEVLTAAPSTTADFELSGDAAHVRLARLADRHGFATGSAHFVLRLDASAVEQLPPATAPPLPAEYEDAFVELHETTFPGTYYSGRQLLDQRASADAFIVSTVTFGELVGYAAGRIDEGVAGYIDFVGVTPAARRRGLGRELVASLARALTSSPSVPYVHLTVSSENGAALALYDTLGFERTSSAVGYRRRRERAA